MHNVHSASTHRGLEAVKKCSRIYLEAYTSILLCDKKKLVCASGTDTALSCKCQSVLLARPRALALLDEASPDKQHAHDAVAPSVCLPPLGSNHVVVC